jgi:hypothetical protein
MAEIRTAVAHPEVPDLVDGEVLADVATVEQRLDSPKPKRNILAAAINSIRDALGGIDEGIIPNSISKS